MEPMLQDGEVDLIPRGGGGRNWIGTRKRRQTKQNIGGTPPPSSVGGRVNGAAGRRLSVVVEGASRDTLAVAREAKVSRWSSNGGEFTSLA
jgi:hypothetical protein